MVKIQKPDRLPDPETIGCGPDDYWRPGAAVAGMSAVLAAPDGTIPEATKKADLARFLRQLSVETGDDAYKEAAGKLAPIGHKPLDDDRQLLTLMEALIEGGYLGANTAGYSAALWVAEIAYPQSNASYHQSVKRRLLRKYKEKRERQDKS